MRELATLYRQHFEATSYKEGSLALEKAEVFQRTLYESHGEEYARQVDALAYRLGHG